MAAKQKRTLEILTTAKDRTKDAFRAIRRRLLSFAASVRRITGRLARGFLSVRTAILGIGSALAAFAGARAFGSIIDDLDELSKTSRRLNLPTEQFSELRFAAELAGVEARTFENGLRNLSTRVNEAARGQARYVELFSRLGVEIRDSEGNLRTTNAILGDLAEAYQSLPAGIERAALMTELFGQRNSRLSTLLEGGAAGLRAAREEAAFYTGSVEGAGAAAEKLNDSLTRLKTALLSVFRGAAIKAADDLTRTFNKLATFIAENRREIVQFLIQLGKLVANFFVTVIRSLAAIYQLAKDISLVAQGILNPFIPTDRQIAALETTIRKTDEATRSLQRQREEAERLAEAGGPGSGKAADLAGALRSSIAENDQKVRELRAQIIFLQIRNREAAVDFRKLWDDLAERYKNAKSGVEDVSAATQRFGEETRGAGAKVNSFWSGFSTAARDAVNVINREFDSGGQFFSTFENNATSALSSIIQGSRSAKEAFQDFARSFVQAASDIIARLLIIRALSAFFGGLTSAQANAVGNAGAAGFGGTSGGSTFGGVGGFIGGARSGLRAGISASGGPGPLSFGGPQEFGRSGGTLNINVSQNITHPDGEALARAIAKQGDSVAAVVARKLDERPEFRAKVRRV